MINPDPIDLQLSAPTGLHERLVQALGTIFDPEIPVNIYDLGLIYALNISPNGDVNVRMTLTAANCPVAQGFPEHVQEVLLLVEGVNDVTVELVWEPPWSRDKMSEAARLQLGML